MKYSKIIGVGSYLPPRIWTNDDLRTLMDTSDEWIQQRTGIQQRHWVEEESTTTTSDLALEASNRALQNAGLDKSQLDLIVLATLSPDHEFPGTACFLQAKLGLPGVPALDIRQQCSGFLYALSVADQFIRTEMYRNVLVVGAEVHSKGLNKSTAGRDMAVLFGDGAGAVVLTATDGSGERASRIIDTRLHADGRFAQDLWLKLPGMETPGQWMSPEKGNSIDRFPAMNGKTVFVNAVKRMPEVLKESLEVTGYSLADVDLFVFHQANLRINEMIAKQMGIPEEKVFNTIQCYGNTTAATIPIGLDEAVKAGKLKRGMLVASAAFGSGFTWASALYRW